jgi:hypothetical protein
MMLFGHSGVGVTSKSRGSSDVDRNAPVWIKQLTLLSLSTSADVHGNALRTTVTDVTSPVLIAFFDRTPCCARRFLPLVFSFFLNAYC